MEQRLTSPQTPNNNTTFKKLSNRHDFDLRFEEKEDDEINAQSTLQNTCKQINTMGMSPDRELLKQKMPMEVSRQNKVKSIADEYYNSGIFHKTNSFLGEIKSVIAFWQEKLRSKRKKVIEQTTTHIKERWTQIQQLLLQQITQWCKTCQKYEISSFLERSQLKVNGALVQLLSQLATKREQIQNHESNIDSLKNQEQILNGEELTSHMKEVKNYYTQIWNKDYEFQVESLEKECVSKLKKLYLYEGLQQSNVIKLSDELKTQLDRLISEYFSLKTDNLDRNPLQQNSPLSHNNRNSQFNADPQPRQSSAYSQKLAQRRQWIELQRLQRDKQWIKLVENLNK